MTARVVYVHGSGPQPSPADLKKQLDVALFGADQGDRSVVAYYADVLHPAGTVEALGLFARTLPALGPLLRGDERALTDQLIQEADPRDPDGAACVRRVAGTIAPRMIGLAEAPSAPGQRMASLLPRWLRGILFRLIVRFLLRDGHAYFFEGSGRPIRERVRAVLTASEAPSVVIGHSLGSVVAYDVLSELGAGASSVSLFVTTGTPLGIDAVKELVHQPPSVPAPVRQWLNAADLLDVVAADPKLADEYPPAERVRDIFVDNPAWNPHDLAGYLSTLEIRDAVGSAVTDAPQMGVSQLS